MSSTHSSRCVPTDVVAAIAVPSPALPESMRLQQSPLERDCRRPSQRQRSAKAGTSSGRSNNRNEPCFVGHSKHLEKLHELAADASDRPTTTTTAASSKNTAAAVFFLGTAGSGKTTLLQRFVSEYHDLHDDDEVGEDRKEHERKLEAEATKIDHPVRQDGHTKRHRKQRALLVSLRLRPSPQLVHSSEKKSENENNGQGEIMEQQVSMVEDPFTTIFDAFDSMLESLHALSSWEQQQQFRQCLEDSLTMSDWMLVCTVCPRLREWKRNHANSATKQEDPEVMESRTDSAGSQPVVEFSHRHQDPFLPRIQRLLLFLMHAISEAAAPRLIIWLMDDLHVAHDAVLDFLEQLLLSQSFKSKNKSFLSSSSSSFSSPSLRFLLVGTATTTLSTTVSTSTAVNSRQQEDDAEPSLLAKELSKLPNAEDHIHSVRRQPSVSTGTSQKQSSCQSSNAGQNITISSELSLTKTPRAFNPDKTKLVSSVVSSVTSTAPSTPDRKPSSSPTTPSSNVSLPNHDDADTNTGNIDLGINSDPNEAVVLTPLACETDRASSASSKAKILLSSSSVHSQTSATSALTSSTDHSRLSVATVTTSTITTSRLQEFLIRLKRENCFRLTGNRGDENKNDKATRNRGRISNSYGNSENIANTTIVLKQLHPWTTRHIERYLLLQQPEPSKPHHNLSNSKSKKSRETKRLVRELANVLFEKTQGHLLSVIYLLRLLRDLQILGDDCTKCDDETLTMIRNMPLGSGNKEKRNVSPGQVDGYVSTDGEDDDESITDEFYETNSTGSTSANVIQKRPSMASSMSSLTSRKRTTPLPSSAASVDSTATLVTTTTTISANTGILPAILQVKLKALPETVRAVLMYAAHLNAHVFSATHLHSVMAKKPGAPFVSVEDLHDVLVYSAKRDFLTPVESASNAGCAYFSFAHVCIHEEIYGWMESPHKQKQLHWAIGQRLKILLKHTSASSGFHQQLLLLRTLAQLNRAAVTTTEPKAGDKPNPTVNMDEKDIKLLVQLNLTAAKRALASFAPLVAVNLLRRAVGVLMGGKSKTSMQEYHDAAWKRDPENMLQVATTLVQAEFACGHYAECKGLAREVVRQTTALTERLPVYLTQIACEMILHQTQAKWRHNSASYRSQPREAVRLTLAVLSQLGETFPSELRQRAEIEKQAKRIHQNLRQGFSCRHLSIATTEVASEKFLWDRLTFLDQLVQITVVTAPNLYALALLRILQLTLEHKLRFASSGMSFAFYGSLMIDRGKYIDGTRFSRLASNVGGIDELFDAQATIANFSRAFVWSQPYDENSGTTRPLEEACEMLIGHGSLDMACDAVLSSFWIRIGSTAILSPLDREVQRLIRCFTIHRRLDLLSRILPYAKMLFSLTGSGLPQVSLYNSDDENALKEIVGERTSSEAQFSLMMVAFHFNDYEGASYMLSKLLTNNDFILSATAKPPPLQLFLLGTVTLSLAAANLKQANRGLAAQLKKFSGFGHNVICWFKLKVDRGATNCCGYLRLLQAQAAVCQDRNPATVIATFEDGIAKCKKVGCIFAQALGCELLSAYLSKRSLQTEKCAHYVTFSRKLYKEWGAHAKALHIEQQNNETFYKNEN